MADQNVNAVGCLGRMLTILGVVWIAIIVLGGMGLLSDSGFSGEFLTGFGGSIIPGLVLLGAGRALRRRAAAMGDQSMDDQSASTPTPDQLHTEGRRVPSIRLEPTPAPPSSPTPTSIPMPQTERTPPKPYAPQPSAPQPRPVDPIVKARRDVAKSIETSLSGPEEASDEATGESAPSGAEPGRHKTSQELVDEARRRWGVDRPR